jgi:hypothetical protein
MKLTGFSELDVGSEYQRITKDYCWSFCIKKYTNDHCIELRQIDWDKMEKLGVLFRICLDYWMPIENVKF